MIRMIKNQNNYKFILASQSPRRTQLLALIGMNFSVKPANINEDDINEPVPEKHVKRLSFEKAKKIADSTENGLVIGADTIVVLDDEILGKPEDEQHAVAMLRKLSGRFHSVFTGFTLIEKPSGRNISEFEETRVHFRNLSDWEINNYVKTGHPMDKAGAYGIQDQSAIFADRIEGCFYNVVGFPLAKFYTTLQQFTL